MKLQFYVIYILILIAYSCKNKVKDQSSTKYEYYCDSVQMPPSFEKENIETLLFTTYNDTVICFMKKADKDTFFVGSWDNEKKSFDFNFKNIPFDNKLPYNSRDSISYLMKIEYLNDDSLLIFQKEGFCGSHTHRLSIYNINTKTIDYLNVFEENTFHNTNTSPDYVLGNYFIWARGIKKIVYPIWKIGMNSEDKRFISVLNLSENSEKLLDFSLPNEYISNSENEFLPFDQIITITENNKGELVFSFAISPMVYKYDYQKNEFKEFRIINEHFKKIKKYSFKEQLNIGEAVRTGELTYWNKFIIYDSFNDLYYRFFLKEMEDRDKNGLLNNFKEVKECGVSIISKDFEYIKDVLFPPHFKRFFYWEPIITKDGIQFFEYEKKNDLVIVHTIKIL